MTQNGTVISGLGGPEGYGELMVPRNDDGSLQLDASLIFGAGFDFFGSLHAADSLFVNTNGTLSFGAALPAYPTPENEILSRDVIAPFWGDVDTRLDGEGAESGAIWVDLSPQTGTLTVTWHDVGVYRRNGDLTNTFQVQLIDRGSGDFDIVFRYEALDWAVGTAENDAGARIGLAAGGPSAPGWLFTHEQNSDLLHLPGIAGNTGVAGLWLYEMRGGAASLPSDTPPDPPVLPDPPGPPDPPDPVDPSDLPEHLIGTDGNDILRGKGGNDTLEGLDGRDTLSGGDGDDLIFGGATELDRGDVIYGGAGNDYIDAGYGNDEVHGGTGDDTLIGSYGSDTLIGNAGDDRINGGAGADWIYGGDGFDFINGGFAHDRLNGGAGGDTFFHLGVVDHGSDWIQDYNADEGDILQYGGESTGPHQFQVNYASSGASDDAVDEAFIIHKPTRQILWALVDGEAQTSINLRIGGEIFDLLA
ncbi:Hemolysin-type calcium-binding repeat-containing protein [Roseovarius pacificus]|uniref:Hemolysin-type calcium-binding repeat-containing protein n=2 Tax=Roseovarius pacificus TaxID=337701 RepID=A0A1M7GEA0_9RHOB|nr:nidogen-like domain-containing protein [Roseovarius pacificus]SHM14455.1 Hemolysin-type calcium-binding repeat-containing protein [Roseovarius pacificus]